MQYVLATVRSESFLHSRNNVSFMLIEFIAGESGTTFARHDSSRV